VEAAEVGDRGLVGDRRWMLVDDDGGFLSQRTFPRMCLIRPRPTAHGLTVEAPGMEPLEIASPPAAAPTRRREVEIWGHRTAALDAGDEAAAWFGEFLGTSCRLVRQADDAHRPVDPAYARSAEDRVSFADGYPFLLTSERSLVALNERLDEPLPMNRFRPNLVVAGAEAFVEDGWERIRIGPVTFSVVKPCTRCKITTVDQETGAVGKEPLQTLADFRRGPDGVEFGWNLIQDGPGALEVGMTVEVVG